jgi:glutamyl-tRNA reductase
VYLYNIDDLAAIAEENRGLREAAAKDAELVVEYGLLQFERWRAKVSAKPEIVDMRQRVLSICTSELQDVLSEVVSAKPELLAQLSHSISQKISHELFTYFQQRGLSDDELDPFVSNIAYNILECINNGRGSKG